MLPPKMRLSCSLALQLPLNSGLWIFAHHRAREGLMWLLAMGPQAALHSNLKVQSLYGVPFWRVGIRAALWEGQGVTGARPKKGGRCWSTGTS